MCTPVAGTGGGFVLFVVIVVSSLSPACLRVYAPLPAGLSKCSSLTQNRSTLSPAAVAKPENWGWGRCRGERRKRNRDTFSLASLSSSAPHATTPPPSALARSWGGCKARSGQDPPGGSRVLKRREQMHFWFSFEHQRLPGPPPPRAQKSGCFWVSPTQSFQ